MNYKKYIQYIVYLSILLILVLPLLPFAQPVYAATWTLFPNAAGTYTSINGATGIHWQQVDETPADDDGSYVQQSVGVWAYCTDTYNIPDTMPSASEISSITIHWRGRGVLVYGGFLAFVYGKSIIYINGIPSYGTPQTLLEAWADYSDTWPTNPADGEAWEQTDINNLEIGVSLAAYDGYSYKSYARATQVYIVVNYTAPTVPAVTTSTTSNITYSGTPGRCWTDFSGEITATGGVNPTIRGFAWGTTCNSTIPASTQPPDSTTYTANYSYYGNFGTGVFNYTSNLTCCTTYCARAYAMNSVGWAWGAEEIFVTMCDPDITTLPATYVQATTARLNALIVYDGEQVNDTRFCYGTVTGNCTDGADCTLATCNCTTYNSTTPWIENTYETGDTPYIDISLLITNTTYYFCAQVRNDMSCRCGGQLTFTTSTGINEPTNFKGIASAEEISLFWVKGSGATYTLIRGKIGSYPSSTLDGSPVYLNTQTSIVWGNLTPGTTYYFRAWGLSGTTYSTSNITLIITTLGIAPGTSNMPTPTTPSTFYSTPDSTRMSNIPFYGLINWWAESFEIPYSTLWFVVAILVSVAAGIFTFWKSQKVFLACIVVAVFMGLSSFMGLSPMWLLLPFILIAFTALALGERL